MLKKLCLFSKFQILLKVPMLLELKGGDKAESRILVFTVYRLFVVTSKVPARIDHHFHYLGKMSVLKCLWQQILCHNFGIQSSFYTPTKKYFDKVIDV